MATDPIRDALRAAGEAARDAFACKPCGEPCTLPPCRCADAAGAAAVAAFLRALPACDVMMDHPEGAMHSTRTLAAAVEAAARGRV